MYAVPRSSRTLVVGPQEQRRPPLGVPVAEQRAAVRRVDPGAP